MTDIRLYSKISTLPGQLKAEVSDYVDFLIQKKGRSRKRKKHSPKAGCMKGTFIMEPGFDDPINDFKEYME
jgi:hypothetical protein